MKKILKPLLIIIYTGFILLFSCEKDDFSDNTCNVNNPLKDLEWLKNDIKNILQFSPDEYKYITITMAKYNDETVFFSIYCDPLIDSVVPVRNCSGVTIGYMGEIPLEEIKDQQEIWRPGNCVCQ